MSNEERLSKLEGRMGEQSDRFGDIANMFRDISDQFRHIDQKFQHIDQKFQHVDQTFLHLDGKIDGIRTEMASQFRWIVGLLLSFSLAILTAVLGVLAAVLKR